MKFVRRTLVFIAVSVFLSACNATPQNAEVDKTVVEKSVVEKSVVEAVNVENKCKDPRPQMCTMIYQPVCGLNKDGVFKTYASDCSACADSNVVGYNDEACKEPTEK